MSVINDALKKASKEKKEVFPKPPEVSISAGRKPASPAGRGPAAPVKAHGNSAGFRPASDNSNKFEKWIMLLLFGVVILLVLMGLFLAREFFFMTKKPVAPLPAVVQDASPQEEVAQQKIVPREPGRDVHIPDKIVPDKPVPPEVVPAETAKEIPEEKDFGEAPEFSLTGIVFGGGEPSAIINGKIVKEGDVIEGAKVLKINPKKVTLGFKGKEISLFY